MNRISRLIEDDGRAWRAHVDEAPYFDPLASVGEPAGSRQVRRNAVLAVVAGIVIVAVAVGIAALATGKSHHATHEAAAASSPPLSGSPDALQPSLAPEFLAVPLSPMQPVSASQAASLTSMPWGLTAIDRTNNTIQVVYAAAEGSCVTPVGIYVDQSSTSVTIEVLSRTDKSQKVCANDLRLGRTNIPLSAPLGTRKLLHAAVDKAWRGIHL